MGDVRQIIRSQVARLEERMDAVNRELMTCMKTHDDVSQALSNKQIGMLAKQIDVVAIRSLELANFARTLAIVSGQIFVRSHFTTLSDYFSRF